MPATERERWQKEKTENKAEKVHCTCSTRIILFHTLSLTHLLVRVDFFDVGVLFLQQTPFLKIRTSGPLVSGVHCTNFVCWSLSPHFRFEIRQTTFVFLDGPFWRVCPCRLSVRTISGIARTRNPWSWRESTWCGSAALSSGWNLSRILRSCTERA